MMRLNGMFIPITTPFYNRTQEVDFPALARNCSKYLETNIDGLVVLGSTGEFPSLTNKERRKVLKCVAQVKRRADQRLIAGVGNSGCEQDVLALISHSAACGYDAVMVLPPFYFKKQMSTSNELGK